MQWDEKDLDTQFTLMCFFQHPILKSWLKPCLKIQTTTLLSVESRRLDDNQCTCLVYYLVGLCTLEFWFQYRTMWKQWWLPDNCFVYCTFLVCVTGINTPEQRKWKQTWLACVRRANSHLPDVTKEEGLHLSARWKKWDARMTPLT